ncbi:AbrB/MazE/SpoVT family DNA-binding domain-containing protein [bacterium]|nr:AbrB/MazE/SpoVT family DNA-binding domain-containing protein [bacterium]
MKRKVIRTGNSLAVTIPASFAERVGIKEGDEAEIETDEARSRIRVQFVRKPQQISLFNGKKK